MTRLFVLLAAVWFLNPVGSPALNAAQRVVLVAGGGSDTNTAVPLKATDAKLNGPFGVDFDSRGNLYLVEMTGHRIRKLDPAGMLTVIAGTGEKGFADGDPALAKFNGIHNLARHGNDLLLADTWNNCVRRFNPEQRQISRVIGTGEKGFSGDGGNASNAKFGGIYCVSAGLDHQLYLADLDNSRIRVVDPGSGLVRTVAGNGRRGVPVDGSVAINAPLNDPRAVIADASGRIFILERSGNSLRLVDTNGLIRALVGTGQKGNSGDDGAARQATMNGPKHLCFDLNGNVIIADTENHVIRRYNPRTGIITRLVGTGKKGARGVGGPPLELELNQPHGVYVHQDGTLYIADSSNHRVLKIAQ